MYPLSKLPIRLPRSVLKIIVVILKFLFKSVDFGFGPVVMDIAKRGIIRFVAKICGTWKQTNLHPLQGFSWLEPQLTASKFAGVGCPQLTHIYSKYRNMICPQQLQQPQLQVSALFLHFWNKKMHYKYALCSRNFQNVKSRKYGVEI